MSAAVQQFVRQFEGLKDTEALARERFHIEQAKAARLEAKATYDQALAQKVESVQTTDSMTGKLSKALLHFYGARIDSEVLATLRGGDQDDREQLESLFEMAREINRYKEPVPVLVDSPQTYGYIDGPSERARELRLVLVNPRRPFFSEREVKGAQLMHAFTGEKADVVTKSFGLLGVTHTASIFEEGGLGAERLAATRQDRCELVGTEERADGRRLSSYSEYAYSGRHSSLITSEDGAPRYTVGWEALDDLVAHTYSRQGRRTAARNVVALAVVAGLDPELPAVSEVLGS